MTDDPSSSDISSRLPDPFVSARLSSPGDPPPRVVTLSGLLGDSDRQARRRLYFTTRLDYYAEFLNSDVIAVEDIGANEPPFVGLDATRVTLERGARIDYVHTRIAGPADEFDLDIGKPGLLRSELRGRAGLTDDQTCGGRRTCFTCAGQPTCDSCEQDTCAGGTCFFQTCGCGNTEVTCATGCGDTCDRLHTCRGTCETCLRTQCAPTCNTCPGRATCQTCDEATCWTCPGQFTCQTCPGQATCQTCPGQATCETCVSCPGQTCRTCDTCRPGQPTCQTCDCDTINPHICWRR
jgi:hypothetical protein